MKHNFKPGDFVSLKASGLTRAYSATSKDVAVVVSTWGNNPYDSTEPVNKRQINVQWISKDAAPARQNNGSYAACDFVIATPVVPKTFKIGDMVKYRYGSDTARYIVVYTDWDRKSVDEDYKEKMKSVVDDIDEEENEQYTKNPEYIYIVRINPDKGDEECFGVLSCNLTLLSTREEIISEFGE